VLTNVDCDKQGSNCKQCFGKLDYSIPEFRIISLGYSHTASH